MFQTLSNPQMTIMDSLYNFLFHGIRDYSPVSIDYLNINLGQLFMIWKENTDPLLDLHLILWPAIEK